MTTTTPDALDRARAAYQRWAWADAYARLVAADRQTPLEPEDLERLATAAYLLGRHEDGCGRTRRHPHRRADRRTPTGGVRATLASFTSTVIA
jgi:hypothetical protein